MVTKNAHLEVLGLTVPLRWFQEYRDAGYVDNPEAYADQFWRSLGRPATPDELFIRHKEKEKLRKGDLGITRLQKKPWFLGMKKEEIIIFYQNSGNKIINTYTRAQQETDVLRKLGQLKRLESLVETGYGITFNNRDDDVIDYIGGIYGLLENGFGDLEIKNESNNRIKIALNYVRKDTSAPHLTLDITAESNSELLVRRK